MTHSSYLALLAQGEEGLERARQLYGDGTADGGYYSQSSRHKRGVATCWCIACHLRMGKKRHTHRFKCWKLHRMATKHGYEIKRYAA